MDRKAQHLEIPIHNIYYLLCYAWNRLDQRDFVATDSVPTNELVDLLGHVLTTGLSHVVRRGLEQKYLEHTDDIRGVRGRINIGETAKRLLHLSASTNCTFDELNRDTLANQLIKATLSALLTSSHLHTNVRSGVASHLQRLRHISSIDPKPALFRRVQLHRNNGFYGFVLDVCALIIDNTIPTEYAGKTKFTDFVRDPNRMPKLFQDFIVNFLKREQRYPVRTERIEWARTKASPDALRVLPGMLTDAVIHFQDRRLILDTKFYKNALARGQYGESLHSGHLYQMFAYMKNMSARLGSDCQIDGILVYPTVHASINLNYEIDGHSLRVTTIDLAQPWERIHSDLLRLVA